MEKLCRSSSPSLIIRDVYSYCSYAFRPEIPWFPDPNININISIYLNILNGNGVSSFRRLFWISISLITIYMILVKSAILSLKRGNLGEDGNGKPASFPRYHYFVVLGVQLIGGAFFQNITKWLLDTFVCNYNQVDRYDIIISRRPG